MSNFKLQYAGAPLRQIMLAEGAEEWRPVANSQDAQIMLPDGDWLYVSEE